MRIAGKDFTARNLLSSSHLSNYLFILLGIILFLRAATFFLRAIRIIDYPFEWSTMDGYFVYYGRRLLAGEPIYFSFREILMPFEYVPLYPAVIGFLARIFGPGVWYERCFSLACSLLMAAFVSNIVYRNTHNRASSSVVGLMCFAPASLSQWYLVRGIDILAALLALAGVVVAEKADKKGWIRPLVAGTLFVLAFYTKQTTVFPAAAAVLFIFCRDFKKGLLVGVGLMLAVTGLFFILQHLTEGWFYECAFLTTAKNPYSMGLLFDLLGKYSLTLLVVFPVALLQAARRLSLRPDIWTLYFFFTLLSTLLAGKAGAAMSYFVPLFSGTCICLGLFLGDSTLSEKRPGMHRAVLLILIVQTIHFFGVNISVPTKADYREAQRLNEHISQRPGSILTERIDSFSVLNGRELNIEAVQLPILILRGKYNAGTLTRTINRREFALIIYSGIHFGGMPTLRQSIFKNYRIIDEIRLRLFYGKTTFLLLAPQ